MPINYLATFMDKGKLFTYALGLENDIFEASNAANQLAKAYGWKIIEVYTEDV